ncbi:MAG: DUF1549 domain-containing protein [Pirellulales bacterium]
MIVWFQGQEAVFGMLSVSAGHNATVMKRKALLGKPAVAPTGLTLDRRPAVAPRWLTCVLLLLVFISSAGAAKEVNRSALPPLEPVIVGEPERIEVYPAEATLDTPRRYMHLVVTGHYADGWIQDLTRAAEFVSSNADVARVESGQVLPVTDGTADVTVRVGEHEATSRFTVRGQGTPEPISFEYETLVALSKQGCNSGACHGSPSGKAGFRLSLRAYDPKLDELTLIRETYGRRVNPVRPEESLILQKPMMQVAHGGGKRLSEDDAAYAILKSWIAESCRVDSANAPECVRLEVYPPSARVLKRPAHTQQVTALAHFSDGTVRDVTDLAVFTSSDEEVAVVDERGLVVGKDRGQAAILVRYLDRIETCDLTFVRDIEGFAWSDPPAGNYIDELVHQKLRQLKYLPSELCTDEEFLRRVYLDLIGVLPTVIETKAFLEEDSTDKRGKLIDALLDRPEHAQFWALKWGDLLRVTDEKLSDEGVHKYYRWLVEAFRHNMPYDQFARELLTAQGSTFQNPPANYYRAAVDMEDCTETTAQLFLGVRIQCAKCHNHPFERWTQDNYYGLAAFFNRVQRKKSPRPDELVVWVARGGEVTQPRTGETMAPWLPLAGEADVAGDVDRRQALATWLTGPDNPFFAKVEANRIWAHAIGRGIVEPIDDFRDSNPPSNAALLDALAEDFIKSGYDRKALLRTILNSRTYQLSANTSAFNADDEKYFSHAQIRLLSAEQLLDAICHVTAVPEKFAGLPAGTHATALPAPNGEHDFLKVFGQPERQTACACERPDESNLSQALQLFNGPLVHGKLRDEQNRFRMLAAAERTDEQIVRELYLASLCRPPSEAELHAAILHIAAKDDRMMALEDVCWALLNTNEFLFQH